MDHYHLSDESSLHSEMQLHEFSGNQALDCSDTFSHDLCPDMRDMIYSGLSNLDMDPSLSATNMNNDSLEDSLDTLSLYSVKDCDSAKLLDDCDPDSRPLLHELGLPAPSAPKEVEQGGRSSSGSGKRGKHQQSSPQAPFLDCSLCGKVFSSTSSLSKHYVTHSQERKHVCKICSKAFKRQDHLSGHMLTHQKTKPFICIEQGCYKSYSDHRSLRRHYEMHHGLRLLKDEEAFEGSTPPQNSRVQVGSSGMRTAERLAVHPESQAPNNSLLPNRDLLRCIVSSLVSQKLPSASSPSMGQSESDSRGSQQPCTSVCGQISCVPTSTTVLTEATGNKVMKEHYPCQKKTASSSMYTIINPGNVSVLGPAENITNLPDRQPHSEPQFPVETTALEYWSNSGVPRFPLLRSQKIPATSHQSSGSFQWVRNVPPACSKSKGNGVYVAQMPHVAGQDVSQGLVGPSHAFDSLVQKFERPDVLSFSPALLKSQGEIPGDLNLSAFEETFRPATRLPDTPKHGVLQKGEATPLFRQLFMKSQESSVNQDQLRVQGHLFRRITKSQHIVSHTQLLAPSQLATTETDQVVVKPLQSVFQQQTGLGHPVLEPSESEGSPLCIKKPLSQCQKDFLSGSEKEGQQPATPPQSFQSLSIPSASTDSISHGKHARTLKDFSSPSQTVMYENTAGNHTYGKPRQLENGSPILRKKEKSKAYAKELCSKGHSRSGRPRRKEKPKFDVASVASPSQVAMASFSLPSTSFDSGARVKPELTIFNRIQGGNIYSITNAVREEHFPSGCSKTGGGPGDRNENGNGFVCTTCSQLFYTERGLNSHMCFSSEQWQSPSGKEKQQAYEAEHLQPQKLSFKASGDGDTPPETKRPSEDVAVAPLVMPVSVPVTATNLQRESKAEEKESQDDKDFQEGMPPKKRKRRTRPKSLFIPPPPLVFSEIQPGTGGCYQSNLRSPVFLMDHLLQGLVQCSPYTPPPMLSPIREGSGLYFNALCSSANTSSTKVYTSVLDGMDGALLFSLVKDTTKISIEPHINIGSRFQAEIPDLQDRSSLENYEHPASLVWKPWGDITTNKETQKRVTDLLKLACSSAMPGGGTNLELAVHCLHEAQGNILEALEILLLQGPQKPSCHPLANYHYSGSHLWTPTEKQLFKKAFGLHKKDFYFIQKKIQTKTVSQCVEYYYSWKKILKFDCSRAQAIEKRPKREQDEIEMDEEKIACSPKKRHCHLPKQENKLKARNYKKAAQSTFSPTGSQKETLDRPRSTGSQGVFPCKECTRVFDKIKSRNAHMKRHRLQEQMEPMIKIKWPIKHLKNESKKEEERNSDTDFLQW
ncbi:zinc finger protein 541 isoform X3 [Rhineura floridana]|nr:zinc finger protein 541 isoform X3 [Rhineura floridana]XP_061452324.1 zinc finger protein 541 isoform X3 [Rhineura floridana]XP_061452326.1 zinc finger protein 541 isoform X3 [Rhineura floridana]XP_061452331.1 zinc finger protein 541 isoform X3 [Rhineura floridana]